MHFNGATLVAEQLHLWYQTQMPALHDQLLSTDHDLLDAVAAVDRAHLES